MRNSNALEAFISELTISQGQGVGARFILLPWQKKFIAGTFKKNVSTAALTMGRGNGKTALISALALAAFVGPVMQPGAAVVILAASFAQARIGFAHVVSFLKSSALYNSDPKRFGISENSRICEILDRLTRCTVRACGSDPRKLHGIVPVLVAVDEPAQHSHGSRDALFAAALTSLGKVEGSRLIAIGTRSPDEAHWFEKALTGGFDYAQIHDASSIDDVFSVKAMRAANPSWKAMPNLRRAIKTAAKYAQSDDAMSAQYRGLRLNLGVDDSPGRAHLISAANWKSIEGDAPREGLPVLGIDMGGTTSMTAASAYWPASKRLEGLACFPSEPDLKQRGIADGVADRYLQMAARGELFVVGGQTIDPVAFIELVVQRFGPRFAAICGDDFRRPDLLEALRRASVPHCPINFRRMGWRDGAEDVLHFQRSCLSGKVVPAPSLAMRAAMGAATLVYDVGGSGKLSKSTQGGRAKKARDDLAASSIMAISEAVRRSQNRQQVRLSIV